MESQSEFPLLHCAVVPFATEGGPAHPDKGPPKEGVLRTALFNLWKDVTFRWSERRSYGLGTTYWQKAYLTSGSFMEHCVGSNGKMVANDHPVIQLQRLKDYVGRSSDCRKWRIITTSPPYWCLATDDDPEKIGKDYVLLRERILPELEAQCSGQDLIRLLYNAVSYMWILQTPESHLRDLAALGSAESLPNSVADLKKQLAREEAAQQKIEQAVAHVKETPVKEMMEALDIPVEPKKPADVEKLRTAMEEELHRQQEASEAEVRALKEQIEQLQQQQMQQQMQQPQTPQVGGGGEDAAAPPPPPPPPAFEPVKIITAEALRGRTRDPDAPSKPQLETRPSILSLEELQNRKGKLKPTGRKEEEAPAVASPKLPGIWDQFAVKMDNRRKHIEDNDDAHSQEPW